MAAGMKVTRRSMRIKSKGSNSKQTGHQRGGVQLWAQDSEGTEEFLPHVENVLSPEQKLQWLRSEIIGNNAECVTPFGKRLILYADHTASGRSLMCVENYIIRNVLPFYGNTHTDDCFVGQRTTFLVDQATEYVKRCLGGTDDEAIFLCGTGSTAAIRKLQEMMGLTATPLLREQILRTLDERKRWVVFVGPYEHNSNLLSWRHSLAEVVMIPLSEDGNVDMDELEAALRNPRYEGRPKLGSFSACSNVTGLVTDTRAVSRVLHANACFACFDFASSGPYVEIDMRSGQPDGYDAVFVSPHKFLGGPGTCGVLLVTRKLYLLHSTPPSVCAGGTVDFVNQNAKSTIYYEDIERREDAGTPGIIQKIRTGLTFWVKELIGTDLISSRETFLITTALNRLSANPKITIHGSTTAKRVATLAFNVETTLSHQPHTSLNKSSPDKHGATGKASPLRIFLRGKRRDHFVIPSKFSESGDDRLQTSLEDGYYDYSQGKPLHGRFIIKLLNDLFGIQGRGGCSCAGVYGHQLLGVDSKLSLEIHEAIMKGWVGWKPGWARISFGYYITQEEFEFMLAAIEFIGEYGVRFLQFYDYDWKTGDWTFKQECKSIVEQAEKLVASGRKQHWWSFHSSPVSSKGSCFVISRPLNGDPMSRLNSDQVSYFQMAESLLQVLPVQRSPRDIPDGLDPARITFRV